MSTIKDLSGLIAGAGEIFEKRSRDYVIIFIVVVSLVVDVLVKEDNNPAYINIGFMLAIIFMALAVATFIHGKEKEGSDLKNLPMPKWPVVLFLVAIVIFLILIFVSYKDAPEPPVMPMPVDNVPDKPEPEPFKMRIKYSPLYREDIERIVKIRHGKKYISFENKEEGEFLVSENEPYLFVEYDLLFGIIDDLASELARLEGRNQQAAREQAKFVELMESAVLGVNGSEEAGIVSQINGDATNVAGEINEARSFFNDDKIEDALSTLDSVIEVNKGNACAVALAANAKGWIYFSQGSFDSAVYEYDRADSCVKENSAISEPDLNEFKLRLYNNMGLSYYFMRKVNEARRYFLHAKSISPENGIATRYLDFIRDDEVADLINDGRILRLERKFNSALAKYTEALEIDPDNLNALSYRGYANYRLAVESTQDEKKKSFLESAKKDVERVLRHDRARWDAVINLIKIVSEAEGLDAAIKTVSEYQDVIMYQYEKIISDCELKAMYPEIMNHIKAGFKPIDALNGGSSDREAPPPCPSDQQQEKR